MCFGTYNLRSFRVIFNYDATKWFGVLFFDAIRVIVLLKQSVKIELNRLQSKEPIRKEGFHNVPLFNGLDSLTRKALKALNEKLVV